MGAGLWPQASALSCQQGLLTAQHTGPAPGCPWLPRRPKPEPPPVPPRVSWALPSQELPSWVTPGCLRPSGGPSLPRTRSPSPPCSGTALAEQRGAHSATGGEARALVLAATGLGKVRGRSGRLPGSHTAKTAAKLRGGGVSLKAGCWPQQERGPELSRARAAGQTRGAMAAAPRHDGQGPRVHLESSAWAGSGGWGGGLRMGRGGKGCQTTRGPGLLLPHPRSLSGQA